MTGILVGTLILITMLLCFIAYLVTTQRSDNQKTMEMMRLSTESQLASQSDLTRLVVTSSNSQSADMTDLVDRVTKTNTQFLELMTLGREQEINASFKNNSNSEQEKEEVDPYENMPWPDNINQALMRERELQEEERNGNQRFATSLQPHSMQPESTSVNGSTEVTIQPL